MFGISFSELVLIFIIGLVIFGPEQMPNIARKVGGWVGNIRRLRQELTTGLYQQAGIEQLQQLKEELNSAVNQMRYSLQDRNTSNHEEFHEENQIQELYFLYQPELDFEHQPELFDE